MIPVEYYSLSYYICLAYTVVFLIFPLFKQYNLRLYSVSENNLYSRSVLILTIFFIGLRDPMGSWVYLGDTSAYTRYFSEITWPSIETSRDYGFNLFMYLSAQVMNINLFYFLCAMLYVLLPYFAFKKWFGTKAWIALLVYVTAMSFWAFGINGLRNGLAASFFIYGLSFIKKPLKMGLLFLLSISFHLAMLLPMAAFVSTQYIRNTKMLIFIWLLTIPIVFFLGSRLEIIINELFLSLGFEDERAINMFMDEYDGQKNVRTFRMDFILYSGIAIVMGYYYVVKKQFNDLLYVRLLNTYIIANTAWILMIYAAYTNRTAYLSWFIMPIVLIYPLLRISMVKKQAHMTAWIVLGSLLFTLIMFFK